MNRKQRRIIQFQKNKQKPKQNQASVAASKAQTGITQDNAQGIIDNLPIPQIVAGINNLLTQLERRKIPISDWDNKERTLYRLQIARGKVYYLAELENPDSGEPEE